MGAPPLPAMKYPALFHCVALSLLAFAPAVPAVAADALADGFRQLPPDARPHTWWHWMNGNITKDGITADLEAMARIGVGGAQIFNVAQGEPVGPVKLLSPEWRGLVKHAMTEADRLGLELSMHNCPGWSESGGPWITPPLAMQQVVWTDTHVHGPQKFSAALPQPKIVGGYYGDIAVIAFPSAAGETQDLAALAPTVTTSAPGADASALLTGAAGTAVQLPAPTTDKPQFLQFAFREPQRFGSVRLGGRDANSMPVAGSVEVSDDGASFRKIADLPTLARGRNHFSVLVPFAETTARIFRIVVTKIDARARAMVVTSVDFGSARLSHTEEQAGFRPNADLKFEPDTAAAKTGVAPERVVDLTAKLQDGRLEWDVPAGDWTIMRLGHTLTGQVNAPAPESGRGLEADKMSRAAVETNFNAMMGQVIADVGPLAGKSFKYVLADSWEAGCENWTPAFRAEFAQRRGYDLLPRLPALAGRVIGSVDASERFLFDYRRTIADLIAQNHYGTFQELCRQHGMQFTAEAPGIGMPTIADELECKGRTDVPMGEFWMDGHNDSKETAVSAHVYGAKIAAAEAFTARTADAKWSKAPFDHKMLGDLHFTLGINRFVFHRYAHQPWLDRVPGMTMGPWGTNFERTNTWWEQARAWMQYLARCQFLLQRGLFAADVCYFYGEGVPNTLAKHEPALPAGYDYDACNAEVLLTRMSVKAGRLVLPDGMSYRLLLLSDSDRMTPAVLRKIRDLVAAGATVVGRRPERSPSLSGYPQCDDEVNKLAEEVWGNCDGLEVTEHAVGHGRVICGRPLAEVLASLGAPPDFAATDTTGKFACIHRTIGDTEVYFISSQNAEATAATLTFRVSGRQPELWHADTGEREMPAMFADAGGRTSLPLRFDPAGSVFVVFRAPGNGLDPVATVVRDGAATAGATVDFAADGKLQLTAVQAGSYQVKTAAGKTWRANVAALPAAMEIAGPWEVRFPPNWGAPASVGFLALASWTDSANEGVKYFSGTATYVKEFELPAGTLGTGRRLWLDLGEVREVAEVSLNGRDLGVLWKPPFRADITAAAQPGKNRLKVRLTNLWPNRLIGDQRLPEAQRRTWATFNPFTADSPLLPSGLLGPVTVRAQAVVGLTAVEPR